MKLTERLGKDRLSLSFEVFPPKTDVGMEKLCGKGGVLEQLYTLNPDYISCTYGAGGTNVGKNLEVCDKIIKDGKTGKMYKTEVRAFIEKYRDYEESFGGEADSEKPEIVIQLVKSKKGNTYVDFSVADAV